MTVVRSRAQFSGVPVGTLADVERDGDLYKVTWRLPNRSRHLVDWFDAVEYARYLEVVPS